MFVRADRTFPTVPAGIDSQFSKKNLTIILKILHNLSHLYFEPPYIFWKSKIWTIFNLRTLIVRDRDKLGFQLRLYLRSI